MNVFFFWMTQNIGGGCKIVGNIQDTYPPIMLEKKNHQFLTGKHPKHYQYFSLLIFFTVLKKRLKVLQLSAVQQLLKHAGLCHQFHNKIGWFPSNYTQEELEDPHTYCIAENVIDIMVAMYSFKAQNDTELSFEKGERLEIIDRPASDPDWLKARNTQAQVGLVPKNYLVELSHYLTNDSESDSPKMISQQDEDIKTKPWYYGSIGRAECDTIFNEV